MWILSLLERSWAVREWWRYSHRVASLKFHAAELLRILESSPPPSQSLCGHRMESEKETPDHPVAEWKKRRIVALSSGDDDGDDGDVLSAN